MDLRCFLPWTARLTRAMGRSFPIEGREVEKGEASGLEAEHGRDLLGGAARDLGFPGEAGCADGRLLLEDVGSEGFAAHDLAGAGDLEAVGGAPVRLDLGHRATPACLRWGELHLLRVLRLLR